MLYQYIRTYAINSLMHEKELFQKILDIPNKRIFLDPDLRSKVFASVLTLISAGELSRDNYTKIKDKLIAHRVTIEEYVDTRLMLGNLKWLNGKLVNDFREISSLNLPPDVETALLNLAHKNSNDPREIINQILKEKLIGQTKDGENQSRH
jgi:hypothetical protein